MVGDELRECYGWAEEGVLIRTRGETRSPPVGGCKTRGKHTVAKDPREAQSESTALCKWILDSQFQGFPVNHEERRRAPHLLHCISVKMSSALKWTRLFYRNWGFVVCVSGEQANISKYFASRNIEIVIKWPEPAFWTTAKKNLTK